MFNSRFVFIIATLSLGACASSPDYVEADSPEDRGYYTQKISDDRFRVVYNGGRRAGIETTRDYALLRAAEITLREGYSWFEIVDRDTYTKTTREPRTGIGYERAYYVDRDCGLLGCSSRVRPVTYTRWEIDNGREQNRHSHSIEIRMGKGELPEDGRGYDANAVISSMWRRM